jgi:hypothetical protein
VAGILIAAASPRPAAGEARRSAEGAKSGEQALPVLPPTSANAAPPRRSFAPPSDGRLTAEQVKNYIAVRRLAVTLSKPDENAADPLAQIARLVAGLNNEAAAASQLGVDIAEHHWVSAQVAEFGPRPAGAVSGPGDELLKAIAAATSKAREGAGPGGVDSGRPPADAAGVAATAAYNRELLNGFKAELDTLKPR